MIDGPYIKFIVNDHVIEIGWPYIYNIKIIQNAMEG